MFTFLVLLFKIMNDPFKNRHVIDFNIILELRIMLLLACYKYSGMTQSCIIIYFYLFTQKIAKIQSRLIR